MKAAFLAIAIIIGLVGGFVARSIIVPPAIADNVNDN